MPAPALSLVQPPAGRHHPDRPCDDPQVERERMVLDVPEVELYPLVPWQRSATVDLSPAGQPGLDRQAAALALGVLLHLDGERRPRADDRHLAPQDVPQVRKLIERVAPEQLA